MGTVTYDVAVSIDGFISGAGDDVSQFPVEGDHVDAYLERMSEYDAVIMGRKTYEFGYQYGLEPGQAPYPNMDHFIVSTTLQVPPDAAVGTIAANAIEQLTKLKDRYRSIYLCGGGELAGLLLEQDFIDRLCLKVAPVVLGQGVKLFGPIKAPKQFSIRSFTQHDSGVTTVHYERTAA